MYTIHIFGIVFLGAPCIYYARYHLGACVCGRTCEFLFMCYNLIFIFVTNNTHASCLTHVVINNTAGCVGAWGRVVTHTGHNFYDSGALHPSQIKLNDPMTNLALWAIHYRITWGGHVRHLYYIINSMYCINAILLFTYVVSFTLLNIIT